MPTPAVTPSGSKPGTPSGGPQLLLKRQLAGAFVLRCPLFFCIAAHMHSFEELKKHPVEGFSAGKYASHGKWRPELHHRLRAGLVDDSNLMEWEVMIIG